MPHYGTWFSYTGTAKLTLAIVLLAAAAALAYAGIRLPLPDVLGRRHQPTSSSTARRTGLPHSGGTPARSRSFSPAPPARRCAPCRWEATGDPLSGGDMLVATGRGRASRGPAPSPPSGRGGSLPGTVFCGPVLGSLHGIADSHPLGGVVSWLVFGPELCKDSRL